jgi:NADH-quinone oxidoreductase subunit M
VLTVVIFLPLLAAAVLLAAPRLSGRAAIGVWVAAATADLALIAWMWWRFDPGEGASGVVDGLAYEVDLQWIPTVDAGYHVGVDGLSLPLLALTGVLFLACAIYSLREPDRPRTYAALFLFLQTACLGTFASLAWPATAF